MSSQESLGYRLRQVCVCCPSSTPRSCRCSQTTDSRHDPERSYSQTPAITTSQHDCTPQLRQTSPPSSAPLTTLRTPQPAIPAKSSPSSRRSVAATSAKTQRPNNHEPNNSRCRTDGPHPPSTMTATPSPQLPHSEEDDSVHHSSEHNFPACQTEPDCGTGRTLCVKPGKRGRT